MHLTLKSCDVRSWRTSDAESLVEHADNRKIWMNLRDAFPHPYTRHEARAFIRDRISGGALWLVGPSRGAVGGPIRCIPLRRFADRASGDARGATAFVEQRAIA